MGQSIEEVLNRLVAVEDAAQQMQDAVDAQKKELAAQMEETKKQLAGMQHKYDTEHDRISDEILQSMIKDVSR